MAWPGYFTFGGTEIINASRTEQYARHAALGWFKPAYRNDALPMILGDTYTSPLIDDAPWTDPDILNSYDFYGVYPLDVTGIEDSTVTAEVVESTRDGGVIQKPRRATKTVVFSAALIGGSECAVEHGMRWLMTVLNRCGCFGVEATSVCGGEDMQWLSCEPAVDLNYMQGPAIPIDRLIIDGLNAVTQSDAPVDGMNANRPGGQLIDGGPAELIDHTTGPTAPTFDLTECLPEYLRTMHKVTCVTGPVITQKAPMTNGGCAWIVEWTVVAGDPSRYAYPETIVQGFMDPAVDVPYAGGVAPPGGVWDDQGFVAEDPPCEVVTFQPIFDPTCPLLIAPPAVPTINPVCFTFPINYVRRMFTIPKEEIAFFWSTVPVITIKTPSTADVRNLRVRFFEDDDNDASIDEPCDPEGDVVFTYLPRNSVVTFDGVAHQIYVDTPGMGRRRADSIATDSVGGPFTWPELSCGCAYVVTVDMEQTQAVPVVDLTLVKKAC